MSTQADPGTDPGDVLPPPPPPAPPADPGLRIPVDPPPPPKAGDAGPGGRVFTQEDVERIRKEEKDKLYPQLQTLQDELRTLREAREAEEANRTKAQAEAERLAREEAEEEMSARELLATRELEWDARMRAMEDDLARRDALLEQERRYVELQNYRRAAIDANAENIMPELRDLVSGTTEDEIDASVASLVDRTARILGQIGQAQQQARQQMKGSSVTAPPVGPMDTDPGFQTITAADIAGMDMATYAKNRDKLMQASRQQRQSGEGRGLFS